jgi:hypothetical protein
MDTPAQYPHTRSMRDPDPAALAWPTWDERLDAAVDLAQRHEDADAGVLAIAALLAEPF